MKKEEVKRQHRIGLSQSSPATFRPSGNPPADPPGSDSVSLVAADENSVGAVRFDDLGQPRWTWITELDGPNAPSIDDTFDYLKALDNDALSLEDEPGVRDDRRKASKDSGYDPYDTVRIKVGDRFKQR